MSSDKVVEERGVRIPMLYSQVRTGAVGYPTGQLQAESMHFCNMLSLYIPRSGTMNVLPQHNTFFFHVQYVIDMQW